MSNEEDIWTSVFIVMGQKLEPEKVIHDFNLVSHEFYRPDQINPLSNKPYILGSIRFDIESGLRTSRLEEQLSYWIHTLSAKKNIILSLKEDECDLFIECWIYSRSGASVELRGKIIQELAEIGVDFEIEFYAYRENDTTL